MHSSQGRGRVGLCSEQVSPPTQVWKRSGAWFYKGLPKYILPLKTPGRADDPHFRPLPVEPAEPEPRSMENPRVYTWARGRGKIAYCHPWDTRDVTVSCRHGHQDPDMRLCLPALGPTPCALASPILVTGQGGLLGALGMAVLVGMAGGTSDYSTWYLRWPLLCVCVCVRVFVPRSQPQCSFRG